MPVSSGMLAGDMSRRGTSPVLIGRGEQMAALEAAFAAVQQGGPSAVLVGGETASVHVSNILGKLGIASRTEAAAKAHALRLFDGSASRGTAASSGTAFDGTASSSPAFG
jgi:hypothetical protein